MHSCRDNQRTVSDIGKFDLSVILIQATDYDDFFESGTTEFVNVDLRNLPDYFGTAIDFYGSSDFSALQLVWTDRNNKFPWKEGFEKEYLYKQLLLDRNAEFKFIEVANLGVFTTTMA